MVAAVPTLVDMILDRVVEQLRKYREHVCRAASGFALETVEVAEVEKLLEQLDLPAWCFRRDVEALRVWWAETSDHRKTELLWIYPHLFAEARQWAELRRKERAARRRAMSQLRAAMAGTI